MVEDQSTLRKIATDHERSTLDEELNRLPDRFRLPLFLCCVEGKSREEAAQQLGWSDGSLKGRLERARDSFGIGSRRKIPLDGEFARSDPQIDLGNFPQGALEHLARQLVER